MVGHKGKGRRRPSAWERELEDRTRRALVPIAEDLEAEFPGMLPYGEPEDGNSESFTLGGTGVYLIGHGDTLAEDILEMVGAVGEVVLEGRWSITGRGECDWPHCPKHPGSGHMLDPDIRDGDAVWVCPVDDAVIAKIGELALVLGKTRVYTDTPTVEITTSTGDAQIVLSDRYRGADPHGTRRYRVTVTFAGGTLTTVIWDDGADLVTYLRDLAADWQGFPGERRYVSPNEDLFIELIHDGRGTLHGTLTLAKYDPKWTASIAINLNSGAHLDTITADLAAFLA